MRWIGQSEYRPRIYLDASFINKNSAGGYTGAPPGEPDGDVVADKNAGGKRGSRAILRALADSGDWGGHRRKTIPRNALLIANGPRAIAQRIYTAV